MTCDAIWILSFYPLPPLTVDKALEDKKVKQKAGRKGKTGMVWDLEIKLIGGKNLMPKDTVGEGTYGTTFSHRLTF